MINLFTGYDHREAVGWHVFVHSVLSRTSQPVAVHRLDACGLPQGSNAFTLSRFLVPYMMNFKGHAIFADGADMLCLGDIAKLDALFDSNFAVQVVKHEYTTRNRRKYIGTDMECENREYPRKNWASLMIINCEHPSWSATGPMWLQHVGVLPSLQFQNLLDSEIGELPNEWNRLVDEGQPTKGAKILHWTAGIPAFPHYGDAPGAYRWFAERRSVNNVG